MKKYFGTDGIRGEANKELTPELGLQLGRAMVRALSRREGRHRVVVGRDTRVSGMMLESALVAGLLAEGAEAFLVGVLPTPAVAFEIEALGAEAGLVISASHNPYHDNGIKVFGPGGVKLPDETEKAIEAEFEAAAGNGKGGPVGRAVLVEEAEQRYIDHLISATGFGLDGLRVALDCAHGSAFRVCPGVFERLGATVEAIGTQPDGKNINLDCGSTHPERLVELVKSWKADVGFALDGDADRCICVDENGKVRDGDYIMAIAARNLKEKGRLDPPLVVTTVMSNLGLYRALDELGVESVQVQVGDRYVIEEMKAREALIGGEQSGHIIFHEHASTGDGTLTALLVAGIIRESGEPISRLFDIMRKYPQVLLSARSGSGRRLEEGMAVWDLIEKYRGELGDHGRVLVRSSGTEPVERVMVEAESEGTAEEIARSIVDAITRELG